jgi:hypothetical protein
MTEKLTTNLGSPLPKGMKSLSLVIGLVIVSSWSFQMVKSDTRPISYLAVGIICLLCSSYRKSFTLSSEGIVREQSVFGRRYREVLPWVQVRSVTLAFKGNSMMVLFEKGIKGWRVLFNREEEQSVRSIVLENRPDIKIEVLQK